MESKFEAETDIVKRIKESSERSEAKRKQLRFAYNIEKLGEGQIEVLKNSEFVNGLLVSLLKDHDEISEKKEKLLENLSQSVISQDIIIRERSLIVLSQLVEYYLQKDCDVTLRALARTLARWLENEVELLPGYAVMIKQIELLVQRLLERCSWHESEKIVLLLQRISTNVLPKSATIRSLSGQVLDSLAKKSIIIRLSDHYLIATGDQSAIKNILIALGRKAAAYNLGRVIHSQSKEERMALINLLPVFGDQVVPVIADCLQHNPPWSVVRNIVYIIGEIGSDANYSLVEQYLSHSDERVQYEMIRCVVRLAGPGMIPRLTKALNIVKDRLKVYVIRLLLEHSTKDEGFFTVLCDLAARPWDLTMRSEHDLILGLANAFKTFPCRHAIEVLRQLEAECLKVSGAEPLCLQLQEAIQAIEPKIRHDQRKINSSRGRVSFATDPACEQSARNKMRVIEKKLRAFIRAGDMASVGGLIKDKSLAAAKEGDFVLAEMLRDRLMQIDPMALEDAIKLGKVIEDLKDGCLAGDDSVIWEDLKKHMSMEEFTALRESFREEIYLKGDFIAKAGETNNKLFFLTAGYISLACKVNGRESFLKRMQPGDILGIEQFFSTSVWTVSLMALSQVQLQILERATLAKILKEYPGIENALQSFCRKHTDISRLLAMSGSDRREFPRFSGALLTRTRFVDSYGITGKKNYEGELVDISKNGLAYTVKVSNRTAARLLLGRQTITDLVLDDEMVRFIGIIVGVRMRDVGSLQYSVHVKLSKEIENVMFQKILSSLG